MKVARAESCSLEADGLLRVAEQSIESGDAVAMRNSTLPSQRETFPLGFWCWSPSVFFPPRPAWHEDREAEILTFLSHRMGRRSACLLQAGVRVTKHETRL